MAPIVKLTETSELEATLAAAKGRLVVIKFEAEWCGPCKKIAPAGSALASRKPQVIFVKVDVDQAPEIAHKFKVTSMPTFLLLKGGNKQGLLLATVRGAVEGTLTSQVEICAAKVASETS